MNIQTRNTFKSKDWKGEKNNSPSETIPDQALSLHELLQRHTRGQEIPMRSPQYEFEELELEQLEEGIVEPLKMDKLEQLDYGKALKKGILELTDKVNQLFKKRQEDLEKDQLFDDVEDLEFPPEDNV